MASCGRWFLILLVVFASGCLYAQAPGGVATNLGLWLKADNGPENSSNLPAANGEGVAMWRDRSGLGRDYTGVAGPTLVTGVLNNNAAVQILAGGFDAPVAAALGTDWTVFTVSQKLASDNNGRLFDGHSGNFLWSHWGNFTNSIFLNGNPSNFNSGIATTVGIQDLRLHVYRRESAGGTLEARADGTSLATFGSSNSASGTRIDINQGTFSASESSHSRVGEMIIYNGALSAADILRIESYLGVKYGLTINHDYVASTGATLWDFTANSGFNSRITVVGRDDASGLDQRVSTSLVAGADVTITAPAAFGTDLSFVALGDNNAANGTSTDVPSGFERRLNRVWRSAVTGTPGTVNISIDLRDLGLPFGSPAASYSLLLDSDGVFADASSLAATSVVNGVVTFNAVPLTNGFVTVSVSNGTLVGPANVTDNLRLWLKADAGVAGVDLAPITSWADQSGNGFTATPPGNAPVLLSNQINGNPAIDFTSASTQHLAIPGGIFGTATFNDAWIYVVHRGDAIQNNTILYEGLAGGERLGLLGPWGDNNVYFDFANGITGRVSGAWGGTINNYNMWTFGSSTGTATPNGTRKAISRDGLVIHSNNNNDSGTGAAQSFLIGGGFATGLGTTNPLDGKIAEVIVYTGVPSALEQEKVQSYLALKYGITKNSADLAATAGQDERDYFASNNAVVWDFDLNTGYNNRITGIVRDNGSQLLQLASRSIATSAVLTLNTTGIGTDNSFLIVGDDNGAVTSTGINVPAGYTRRVARIWRAQVSGSPGSASVSFDLTTGIFNSGNASDYALVIKNSNSDFSTGATLHTTGASIVNNVLTFTNVNFASGDYFTLAQNIVTPLAAQSPVFWVKGSAGITGSPDVNVWADQSGSGTNAVQNTPANQPTFTANDINGNPTINFSGNTDIFSITNPPANLNSTIFTVGVPTVNTTWRTMFRGSASDHPIIVQASGTGLGYFDNDNGGFRASGFTWLQNEVAVVAAEFRAGDVNFRKNGAQGASINTIDLTGLNLNFFGNFQGNNQQFGRIAETLIFNSATPLTTTEKEIIESYLAAKYGTTLSHNYLTTGSAVYWNTTVNAAYNNRVVAIGKDDGFALDQRRSRSVQTANPILTVEKATPATPFTTNFDFLAVGDDNGLLTATSTNVHSSRPMRVMRVWKSALLGAPGNVNLSFDLGTGIFNSGNASDYRLLINTSGTPDFTTASDIGGATLLGNVLTFANVALPDGAFFTLGLPLVSSPGGVVNNLRAWFKADAGITGGPAVAAWQDQTSNNFVAAQGTVANQPQQLNERLNFNPAIQFDGSNDQLTVTGGILQNANYNDINIFAVSRANLIQNNALFAENVTGGQLIGRVPWGDNNVYWDAGIGAAPNRLAINWGGTLNTGFLWSLLASTSSTALGNRQNILRNGLLLASDADLNPFTANGSNFLIGTTGSSFLNGEISELLVYTGPLSAAELRNIQSYLAVKYGISIDQSIAANYTAANGNVIWDATVNAAYRNRITGIGRDDASVLDQRKSKSVSTSSVLTIEKENPLTAFGTDGDFFFASDDGGILGASTNNVLAPYPMRVTRIWRAEVSGTPGLINVSFDLGTGIFNSGNAADYAILIKTTDTDFSTAVAHTAGASINSNVLTFTGVNLPDGAYFTLALPRVSAPGGVVNNLRTWLRADAGVTATPTVTAWQDQTTNAFVAAQATGANQPALVPTRVNFNPAIQFDGANDQLVITGGIMGTNSFSDVNVFAVTRVSNVQASSVFFETQAAGGRINAHMPWVDGQIYWDAGSAGNPPHRINAPWGGAVNTPFLWSLLASTNSTATGNRQDILRDGQTLIADGTMATYTGNNSNMFIGSSGGANYFNGEVTEWITYTGPLSATELNRIQSYLAIKYGITLNQTVPANYVASNGTIVWDATVHAGFANRLTAIGRDEASTLDQRRSRSERPSAVVTIEKADETTPFADFNFIVVGDNGGSLGATTANLVSPFPMRVTRIWRAELTGAPGAMDISFELGTGIYNSGDQTDYALIIKGADTNFESGSTVVSGGILTGNILRFDNVVLTDNDYFTLALPRIEAPGGVIAGLGVWLKANAGVFSDGGTTPAVDGGPVQRWADQTSLANNATQTGIPFYNTSSNLINFNPTIFYDGTSGHNLSYSTVNQFTLFTMGRLEGTLNRRLFSSRVGNALTGTWNGREDVLFLNGNPNFLSGIAATTNPRLYTTVRANSGAYQFFRNGQLLYGATPSAATTWQYGIANGGATPGESSRAFVSEVIQYDRDLTATEINRVQSYLAIKYGVTLNQATPTNYVASNGTVIWNATTNIGYAESIAGIGRDDASALSQVQSQSINPNPVVSMNKGGTFGNDLDFVMWGSNNAYLSPTTTDAFSPAYPYRLGRIWRVDISGTPGDVTVTFDLSGGIFNSTNASDYALLIHSSTAFASGVAHITGRSLSGSTLTFTNVNFADGDYFTLGMPTPPAPGGVVNNLNLWLKANQGVTGGGSASAWADQSGNNFNVTQATGANQPAILSNQFNFNPSLQFDGSNDNLQNAGGTLGTNTFTDVYAFAVSRTNVVQNSYVFFETNAVGQFSLRAPWSDGNIYWEPGNTGTNRVFANWGGNTTSPFLWALTASTTATPSGQRQDILRNGFTLASDLTMNGFSGNNSAFSVGSGGGSFYRGEVGEVVIYRGPLTAAEMNRVQGYLAIKYGITLNGINYLNAAGTSIYNLTTTHAAYGADITGIGRDDASALSQLKSRSVNTPTDAVALANGDFLTPAAFANSGEFLVWGHNSQSLQADVAAPVITHAAVNIQRYLARVWSTQLTGSPAGNVVIEVDLTRIAGTNDPNQIRLLFDRDAVFGNGSPGEFTYSGTVSGSLVYFTVPYTNIGATQAFFTIGSVDASTAPLAVPAPGGVVGNMRVWLRADAGVTGATPVTSWQDQSTNSFQATAPLGNRPDLINNAFNNNPALEFTRSNSEFLQIANGIMGSASYPDAWIYVVSQANSVVDQTVLYERMASGETFNVLVPWSDANTYFDFGVTGGTGRIAGNWGANTSTHFMWTYGTSTTSAATPNGTRKAIARDGGVILSNNNNDIATGGNQNFLIGGGYNSGVGTTNTFNGRIAEVIVFGEVPTSLEQERVHSYLGIKYGISKNSPDLASTPAVDERDYFAANGNVVWDFSANAPFNSRVAGLARDDASGLNQLRSQNKNPQAIVTMEKTGSLTDQDFLLWGDDNGLLGLTASDNAVLPYRSGRVWRVDQQGTPGAVSVSFDLGGAIYNSGNAADYRLLVGNSPTSFAAASVFSGTISSGVITFTGITFTDSQYFTLAIANMPAPGGVVPNLHYWVKADQGVVGSGTVSAWNDQSGNGFNVTQATVTAQPTILTNRTNFNPSIQFDGGSDRLSVTSGILGSAIYTDFNVFALTRVNTVQNSSLFYELQGSPAGQFNAHVPWGDNNLYWDAGSAGGNNRLFTNWGGATNTNFLWNLLASTTNTVSGPGNRQEIFRNGRRIANDNTMNSFGNGLTPPNAFFLGSSGGANFFNGEISELVMYRGPLSLSQMQRIQSYLAIKWGLSLDQTTPTSYHASDWNGTTGTIVWNAATAGVFRTDITAIGRDDLSALSTRQSASINAGNILTIGNTTIESSNAANPNDFAADRSFFAWAHNNGAVAALNVTDFGTTVNSEVIEARIARTWLANETGTVGTLRLRFNLATVPGVGGVAGENNLANVRLLVDADGTFATGATSISPAFADNGTDIVEFNHDFTAGTGFYFTIGSTDRLDTPLPVELLFFTAKPTANGVELSWATSSEKNNDYFVVEKSITPDVWSAVTNVKGQGTKTTRTDYAAIDAAPLAATVYYRLRQVDLDGTVRYSNVVRVTTKTEELVIYPNPSNGQAVSIVVNPRDGVQGGLEVSSLQGVLLKRWETNFTEGRQQQWTVPADDLAPGVYLVTLRTGGRTVVRRLVVIK